MDIPQSQINDSILEEECFIKANQLIVDCHLHIPKVASLCDINSRLFVQLFSAICNFPLPDIIDNSETLEDETHNIQSIINTLSLDILGISMSHITGEDIVAGNILSIHNLLEILEGFMFWFSQSKEPAKSSLLNKVETEFNNSVLIQSIKGTVVCSVCGYKKKLDQFVLPQARNFTFSCPLCQCPISLKENSRFTSIRSSANYKFYNSSQASTSYEFSNSAVCRSQDELLINSSTEINSSDSRGPILPPSLVESKKLRPEFERIGVRELDSSEQTSTNIFCPSSSTDFSTLSFPGTSELPIKLQKPHSSQESINDTFASLPLNTVILKEPLKKIHSSSKIHKILQCEKTMRGLKTTEQQMSPKRRMSKSMDDIRCLKKDQMVQTSKSLLLANTMVSKAEKEIFVTHSKQPFDCSKDKNYQQSTKPPKRKSATPYSKSCLSLKPQDSQRRSASCSPPLTKRKPFQLSPLRRRCSQSSSPSNRRCTQSRADLDLKWVKESYNKSNQTSKKANTLIKEILEGLVAIRKNLKNSPLKKSQTQLQLEEANKRQEILSKIINKEIHHDHSLGKKSTQKSQDKENLIDSALLERCWRDIYNEACKKIQQKNVQNQQSENDSYDHELWQKVHYLLKDWQEESQNSSYSKNYLDDLENYYRNQFVKLAESIAVEKRDIKKRKKAQKRVLKMMKNQFHAN